MTTFTGELAAVTLTPAAVRTIFEVLMPGERTWAKVLRGAHDAQIGSPFRSASEMEALDAAASYVERTAAPQVSFDWNAFQVQLMQLERPEKPARRDSWFRPSEFETLFAANYTRAAFNITSASNLVTTIDSTSGTELNVSVTSRPHWIAAGPGKNVAVANQDVADEDAEEALGLILEALSAYGASSDVEKPFRVFLGHGARKDWIHLRQQLIEKTPFEVEAFETKEHAGEGTLSAIVQVVSHCKAAIIVMTAEDELADGSKRARENVVHEIGLCQGLLGVENTLILLENEVSEFSNIKGITQIRFDLGNLLGVYDKVVKALEQRCSGAIPQP